MTTIAITGGIGSGKSTVSMLLGVMGYAVYDCDARAKALMAGSESLRRAIVDAFGEGSYLPDGTLNTRHLASVVFASPDARRRLDALVHPAVGQELERWCLDWARRGTATVIFYESAILYESGFDRYADAVWCVSAPLELRVARTMARDGASREAVMARIGAQMPQDEKERRATSVIVGDATHSVIAQVNDLLSSMQPTSAGVSLLPRRS